VENLRSSYIKELLAEELQSTLNYPGIETLGHLSLHYMLSPKHGRKLMQEYILKLECANYYSLEHTTSEYLQKICDKWL
jgi:hypothetical protein